MTNEETVVIGEAPKKEHHRPKPEAKAEAHKDEKPQPAQKPTIGRIVMFQKQKKVYAAIVTEVLPNGNVELTVFMPRTSGSHAVNVAWAEKLSDDHWTWPARN